MTPVAFPAIPADRFYALPRGYAFVVARSFDDAWGDHRVTGVLCDLQAGTVQVDAWATGPGWAGIGEVLRGAMRALFA